MVWMSDVCDARPESGVVVSQFREGVLQNTSISELGLTYRHGTDNRFDFCLFPRPVTQQNREHELSFAPCMNALGAFLPAVESRQRAVLASQGLPNLIRGPKGVHLRVAKIMPQSHTSQPIIPHVLARRRRALISESCSCWRFTNENCLFIPIHPQ